MGFPDRRARTVVGSALPQVLSPAHLIVTVDGDGTATPRRAMAQTSFGVRQRVGRACDRYARLVIVKVGCRSRIGIGF